MTLDNSSSGLLDKSPTTPYTGSAMLSTTLMQCTPSCSSRRQHLLHPNAEAKLQSGANKTKTYDHVLGVLVASMPRLLERRLETMAIHTQSRFTVYLARRYRESPTMSGNTVCSVTPESFKYSLAPLIASGGRSTRCATPSQHSSSGLSSL